MRKNAAKTKSTGPSRPDALYGLDRDHLVSVLLERLP